MNNPVSLLVGDPSKFGRVGEDGTVYVKTINGERAVGSYPGKSPEEALAYFVRKYEQVAAEIGLLGARVRTGAMDPKVAEESVKKLRDQVENLNGVGDLLLLRASVEQIPILIEEHRAVYEAKKAEIKAARDAKRGETLSLKEKIVAEAESLADSVNWKQSTEKLKTLIEEWKKAPRLDKKTDSALWKRFSSSRNKFDKRRRKHFATLGEQFKNVATTKEQLVAEAEKLMNSKEWLNTARRYASLMDTWKKAGRGKKSSDDQLWLKFKAAQDHFFANKNADMEKRKGSMSENFGKAESFVKEIEALSPVSDFKAARRQFRDLESKFAKVGMLDKKQKKSLEKRIEKIDQEIFSFEHTEARKSDPSAKAQANSVVQGLIDAIENYEAQAAKAEAAGQVAKAMVAREAAAARRAWLEQAEKGLAEFKN